MADIFGNSLNNILNGTANADVIFGYGGQDTLNGMGGNDILKGGGGADALDGGSNTDTADYADSGAGVLVSLATGQGFFGSAEGDTLIRIENLGGSSHADTLVGDGNANELHGNDGNDTLKGGGGVDTLYGGSGNDILKGGTGGDVLNGGSDTDTASYADSNVKVDVSLIFGITADGAVGDQLISIENLTGSGFDDHLEGDHGVNVIRGEDGHDTLAGQGGTDTLYGGAGNDWLFGGDDIDTMIGGADGDTYFVEDVGDKVVEQAGGGTDLVYTHVTYELASNVENLRMQGSANLNAVGNALDNEIHANNGNNGIDGGAGADTLVGFGGNDSFIFAPGHAHGDTVVDFAGNGGGAGDMLVFSGYGPGATFTQVDGTHWQVNYNGGASHDVITFLNGAAGTIHPSDYTFV